MSTPKVNLQFPNGKSSSFNGGLYIDGKWVPSESGEKLKVYNPANKQQVAEISVGDKADVDKAVKAARHAFQTNWGLNTTGPDRGASLHKLADLIAENMDELAAIESVDNGKPYAIARNFDIPHLHNAIRYFAGWADKNLGQVLESESTDLFQYTRLEPIGVCAGIIPWNYPAVLLSWKLGPGLATGNTMIFKTAEDTPLSALRLFELIDQAGFPKGVVNLVTGYGPTVGMAFAEHPDIDKIGFTGSTRVGRLIMQAAAQTNLKKVTLELGGKSPSIVLPDADLEQAISWCSMGTNFNMGQTCCAGSRIYVHESVYDKFLEGLKARFDALKVGDPFEENVYIGPQVSQAQYDRIMKYIDVGKQEGELITGGRHVSDERYAGNGKASDGWFIEPTIFTDLKASDDARVSREEIFGPVAVVHRFKNQEELVQRANDSNYGLAAGVFSRDISNALQTAHAIQAGSVWVNTFNHLSPQVPFGGYKESGIGRENGAYVLNNYVNVKAVTVNISAPNPF